MEQQYYCKKRCTIIDQDFRFCETCSKDKLSGFIDIDMCKQFNISYVEEELEKW